MQAFLFPTYSCDKKLILSRRRYYFTTLCGCAERLIKTFLRHQLKQKDHDAKIIKTKQASCHRNSFCFL